MHSVTFKGRMPDKDFEAYNSGSYSFQVIAMIISSRIFDDSFISATLKKLSVDPACPVPEFVSLCSLVQCMGYDISYKSPD